MPSSVPSRDTDLPRNPPTRQAPRQLDDVGMVVTKRSREPVSTTESSTPQVRHRGVPKSQMSGRLLRRAERKVRRRDRRNTVVDSDDPGADGRHKGRHLRMAPKQGAKWLLQENGEVRRRTAKPLERGKEFAPKQVRQATLAGARKESPRHTVRIRVATTTGRVGGAGQATLQLHDVGRQSATHRRQKRSQQVRSRHACGRHLSVQEPVQIPRRQGHIGKGNRSRVDIDSEDHRARGLPKPIASVRQGLPAAAVRDEHNRRPVPPRIGRGRRHELRRM